MKYILFLVIATMLFSACVRSNTDQTNPPQQTGKDLSNQHADTNPEPQQLDTHKFDRVTDILPDEQIKNKKAVIQTSRGTIEFELLAEDAPLTVSNFVFLVNKNFYNGLTFHRVVKDFVIQGGDPEGTGAGGPGYTFRDEPVKRDYNKGIVAMANRGPNTNGSQFFIMLKDHNLPPAYTIFGKVIKGMDVVEKIKVGDIMKSIKIQPLNE